MKRTIIGLDLQSEFSQISYYNERSGEVESVSISSKEEQYLIPTPKDLFSTIEEAMELGTMSLANFIKTCISYIHPTPDAEAVYLMITMQKMEDPWVGYLKTACEMIGIEKDHLFLQTYSESFCCYVLNHRKDYWSHTAALFDYRKTQISSCLLHVDSKTRPAFVTVTEVATQKIPEQGTLSDQQWNELRDKAFLNLIKETFEGETISSAFLIGEAFDKSWAISSLQFLCRRRHVFQGVNLYTKGACYGLCQKLNTGKNQLQYLYRSEDLVLMNLSMVLEIRGVQTNYLLVDAGINWFDAEHTCEIILDHGKELVFTSKSMMDGETVNYAVPLVDLEDRPSRTTRLLVHVTYQSATRCKVHIKDLGFGDLFPSSGLTWESTLNLE